MAKPTGDEPLFQSVPETARQLGVSQRHVYALVERGEVPSVRLGGRVLVPRSFVRELIAVAMSGSVLRES